ncbi:MAG: phosphatidate cytidylyltransferase [Bacillota bacterium]|nr:phosphatidate cytidylyltransferase [Bacillota bacterium]
MFFTRLLSSIGILLLYVFVLIFANTPVLNIFVAVVGVSCVYELFKCTGYRESKMFLAPSVLVPVIFAFSEYIDISTEIILVLYILFALTWLVFTYEKTTNFSNLAVLCFMTIFVSYCLSAIISLRTITHSQLHINYQFIFLMIFGASISDVFAYLFGITMGRHKLVPLLSPKKTVEGAVGSIFGTAAVFTVYAFVLTYAFSINTDPIGFFVLGAVVSVVSQIGDLSASLIKRYYGIKDYSKLIPGHGGVMDRVDSWLFVAPLIYFFVNLGLLKF